MYALLNKAEGMAELMEYSCEELGDMLGSAGQGKELYEGLHSSVEPRESGDTRKRKAGGGAAGGPNKKSRFKGRKK